MKLPKPGKINIPKPKIGKPGKFSIKNGFLKKNLITLVAIAVLLIGTGTAYGTLSSRDIDRGYDPINGVNDARYQVLVSGEGYKLTKQQERNYKLQKKQNEKNAAQAIQAAQTPTTLRTSAGTRTFRTPHYTYRPRFNSTISKNPRVSTNIQDQIRNGKASPWAAGDDFKFRVVAYAYPYGSQNALKANNVKVTASGGTLTSEGSKNGYLYYSLKLAKGQNKITVTATDKKNKKTTKVGPYSIYAGTKKTPSGNNGNNGGNGGNGGNNGGNGGNGGNNDTPEQEEVEVTVFVGDDFELINGKYKVTDETTAYELLKKISDSPDDVVIEFDDKNIKTIEGNLGKFVLDREDKNIIKIYKTDKNIPEEDEVTSDDVAYNEWCDSKEAKVNKNDEKQKLGINYPFSVSQWKYNPDQKISASSPEIHLEFKLY